MNENYTTKDERPLPDPDLSDFRGSSKWGNCVACALGWVFLAFFLYGIATG